MRVHAGGGRPWGVRRTRGLTLLEVMLLIAALGGLTLVGFLEWQERSAAQTVRQERQSLSQADAALLTFATVARRLPCPDVDRDGLEDCASSGQKGWLPTVTLRLAGADAGVGIAQLRYLVQRGGGDAGLDLTALSDSWRPLGYDDGSGGFQAMLEAPPYPGDILTLPDFCQRVDAARAATATAGMAQVNASPARTVAYALVHPGLADADGDGTLFDGENAAASQRVEDPDRSPGLATYDDLVLERSFQSLRLAYQCQPLIDSINTVALGLDVVEQVAEMRQDNIDSAVQAVAFAALGAAITAVETVAAALELTSEIANASAAWALCAASLGLAVNACAAAPQHTAAAALVGGVIAANIASIAANVTAAVMAGNALALANNEIDASDLDCGPQPDVAALVAAAEQEVLDAQAALAALIQQINDKTAERDAAITQRANARNNLYTQMRDGGIWSERDGAVTSLLNAAAAWETADLAYQTAEARVEALEDARDNWLVTLTDYNAMLANRSSLLAQRIDEIAVLDQQIADLNTQIASETDPVAKASLEAQRNARVQERAEKDAERMLLDPATIPDRLQEGRDEAAANYNAAVADLPGAIAARNTAWTARNTAQTNYQTARSQMFASGIYRHQMSSGGTYYWTCSAASCDASTEINPNTLLDDDIAHTIYNVRNDVLSVMATLMGGTGDTYGWNRPADDSLFLRPGQLQREIDALELQRVPAQDRVDDAIANRDAIVAEAAKVPACNISGTGVGPMPPSIAEQILINVDRKGGTR